MKQGHILNRIVVFLLFGAVLIYMGVSVWQGLTGRMTTVVCYSYTLDDEAEATGYLAREEYVLPARSALADVLPAEGEKVAVGETVAYLYQDASALSRRQELRRVELELEQLSYASQAGADLSDSAKLTEAITDALVELRASASNRDFTGLEEDALALRSLVYKRDFNQNGGGDAAGLAAQAAALTERKNQLVAQAAQDTEVVRTDRAGVFSGMVDGLEEILTPAALEDLTPSRLDRVSAGVRAPSETVGKLITSSRWYFVCSVSEAEAKRLTRGWQVKVRFFRDWSGEVSMRVEHLSEPENGRVAVVFSSSHYLSETTLLRRQTVDIVYSSVTGIRIPKNALHQDETGEWSGTAGQWGVFAVVGAQSEFKPVTIMGDDEDYYLVQPATSANDLNSQKAKKALRPGDEIILRADGLYDGKVVR